MATPIQLNVRNIKRGEVIVKAGDRPKHIFIVKSGRLSVLLAKATKNIELFQADVSHSVAEEMLISAAQWCGGSAVATQDGQLIELPLNGVKESIDSTPAPAKALFKGLLERVKSTSNELKEIRIKQDQSPCPGESTARVFGVILHSAKAVGKAENGIVVVDWAEFSRFATEIFQEPANRVEEAVYLVSKLGYAEVERDPSGALIRVKFKDLGPIEYFFEFFHTYYFKGGYAELLKTNEKSTRITHEFLKIADGYKPDRAGMVTMPFKPTIDAMKSAFGGRFEPDQLFALQNKGLMVKLTATGDGGNLSFYRQEFTQMLICWRFLKEIESWNELGYVNLTPPADPNATKSQALDAAGKPIAAVAPLPESTEAPARDAADGQVAANAPPRPREVRVVKPPTNSVLRFRKHEYLYKAGEPADRVFLLQAGLVSLTVDQAGLVTEIGQATAPQMIGEEALSGVEERENSAMALNDTEALELSLQQAQALVESFPPPVKVLVKSLLSKQRSVSSEVSSFKTEAALNAACPHDKVPRLFAVIYHATKSTGRPGKDGKTTVVWPAFRKYCHWGLLESPVRLEQAIQLLAKVGYADLQMVKSETDPDAPDELGFVHFHTNFEDLSGFYRFYQEQKGIGFDAMLGMLEPSEDPTLKKYLAILREIQIWNKNGKVDYLIPVAKAA